MRSCRVADGPIWPARAPEGMQEPEDLVIGDASDSAVLDSAGIANARAVLALGADDSDNAFATLAAKDANAQVRTVLAVSDARGMGRVRHVRPDAVLALPAIGGELLAMVLSGEEVNLDGLLGQLLKLGDAENAAAGVKYFSGTATYATTIPASPA